MPSNSDSQPPPRPAGGSMVSLYANLLDPSSASSPASISRAPVVFQPPSADNAQQDEASAKKQQISAAALRFQPTKRPQISAQKPKPKPPAPKPHIAVTNAGTASAAASQFANNSVPARLVLTSSLADWTGNDEDDVNGFYGTEKRQRGGRKKRKKNRRESTIPQNWDDIYDPSRPNNYEEYRNSDERIREVREWKDRLYAHRRMRRASSGADSDDDLGSNPYLNRGFAPPMDYSFAPPENFGERRSVDGLPEQPSNLTDDLRGEDAYARRLRLGQALGRALEQQRPSDIPNYAGGSDPNIPPSDARTNIADKPPAATISRAPVRYSLPPAPPELPSSEAELEEAIRQEKSDGDDQVTGDTPRSLRPGQKGFAERLMSKYGWTKGAGLGASGSGIINPLRVQVDKQKKKPDSEGGGFVGPAGRGKIIGGRKKGGDEGGDRDGKFGAMSEVIVLRGMVEGMDLDEEMEGPGEGGLMQEIGDECSEKYGRVERVFIDRSVSGNGSRVFVKFTSQLSALRAVNALEGRMFNGNTISARFFDLEKFESGIFE